MLELSYRFQAYESCNSKVPFRMRSYSIFITKKVRMSFLDNVVLALLKQFYICIVIIIVFTLY